MRKEVFETGKTVDTAIDAACEKLGCSRDDCEWEIIDLPKKGFLGLKNIPAKVRVSIEAPDEKPAQSQRLEVQKPSPQRQPRQQPEPPKPQPQKQERIQKFAPPPQPKRAERENTDDIPGDVTAKEETAKQYLMELIRAFGLTARLETSRDFGGYCINIVGDGLGAIIGRRGETLDAIQYLVSLVANRGEGDYLRLTVDCGNYRLKRKDTLEALAKKLAGQVLKTDVSKTLEPMNPFERRIIHATVSEIEGVSSSSVGEEPNRRVVISSPTSRPSRGGNSRFGSPRDGGARGARPPRRDDVRRDSRGGRGDRNGDRDRRGGRPPRPAAQVQQGPPKQTPEAEATTGVSFGKIDLE